jgi:hypothetical protein
MSTTTALATTAPVKRAKSATTAGFSKSKSKPIEVVRVPGQFDRVDQDLVVATPTCCCCCCCLVTTFSTLAYSSAILTAETRKQNDPVARRFWFGFAGFVAPIVASTISRALLAAGDFRSRNLIASSVLYIAVFTGLMLFLVGKASRNTRLPKQVATECVLFSLIAGVCLVGEFFSVGFVVFGQLAALFVPFLIGNSRGFRGVDKSVAMAHRQAGGNTAYPATAVSVATATTSAASTMSGPTVWSSIEDVPSPAGSPSPTDPANPFPAFPNYVPPSNDTPPSTDL